MDSSGLGCGDGRSVGYLLGLGAGGRLGSEAFRQSGNLAQARVSVSAIVHRIAVRNLHWVCSACVEAAVPELEELPQARRCHLGLGPLPLIISNGIFLKISRMVVALLAFSWLVKLVIIAVAVGKYIH